MRLRPLFATRPRDRRSLRPRFDGLEDRSVPSTFAVTNGLDAGPGSLRQAIASANGSAGPDTIVFAKNVHKISLTSGELAIGDALTIAGPGAKQLEISGGGAGRVVHVLPGASATIAGVSITGGVAAGDAAAYPSTGGGVLNQGDLTLAGVEVAGNRAVGDPTKIVSVDLVFNIAGGAVGAGLANFGTLTVVGSTISGNQARGADNTDASALPFFGFPGNGLGGGLANFGQATIVGSQFVGNGALAGSHEKGDFAAIGGGGAILNDASLTVIAGSFRDNTAVGGNDSVSPTHNGHALGGAIMSGTLMALFGPFSADLTVQGSEFVHNQALGGNDNTIADPAPPPSDAPNNAYGGGILVYQGTASIGSSVLRLNRAVGGDGATAGQGVGGGIFFYNFVGGVTATLANSAITDNAAIGGDGRDGAAGGAGLGGGIAVGGLGSIYAAPGAVTIAGTLVARNLAQGGDGGHGGDGGNGLGGGLYSDGSSTINLIDTAIVQNRAKGGHGRAGGRNGVGLGDNRYGS